MVEQTTTPADPELSAQADPEAPLSARDRTGSWWRALRDPRFVSGPRRTRRAWLLLVCTLLLPGSAQLAAGSRRLGRVAVRVSLVCWALVLLAALSAWLWPTPLIFLLTNGLTAAVMIPVLVLLAVAWLILLFDTLRLIRPGLLTRGARRGIVIATILAMLLTSGGLLYSAHLLNVTRSTVSQIFGGGMPFRPVDGRYNILLMGADAGPDRVGLRPDSMTVISIDADSGQAATISLPRNLQNVPFPQDSPMHQVYPDGFSCGDECLLNAVYTDVMQNHRDVYGQDVKDPGVEAMKDAASGVTGLEIQGYAMIDMAGFQQLIDALGGITIDVGGRVPIGGGHNELTGEPNPIDGYIEPGVQKLDGYHALWYGRSREGASDYDRQARQRCVQTAMLKQLDPVTMVSRFDDLAKAGVQVVETDIPQASIGSFVQLAKKSQQHDLVQFAAGPPFYDPLFPTYPDYDQLHRDIRQLLSQATGDAPAMPTFGPGTMAPSAAPADPMTTDAGSARVVQPVALVRPMVPAETADQGSGQGAQAAGQLSPNGTCSVP